MKRIIYTAVAAATVLAGTVAAAAPAFASNGPAQFVTHEADHPDTTSFLPGYPVAGQDATIPSANGPVWAWDNLSVKLVPAPVSGLADGANYQVAITVTGSFAGFADPTTGAPLQSSGPVKGTISYDVLAAPGQVPDGAGLPSQEAGGISAPGLHTLISQLFDGHATVVGGGDVYTFSYQNGSYVQVGAPSPATTGDVRGH